MPLRQVHEIMGIPISLDLRDDDSATLLAGVDASFAWLRAVDERFSPYKATSEVTQLANGLRDYDRVSTDMAEVLALCREYEQRSGGAFSAWLPGRLFDPSGIVKGWAVQRAGEILRAAGGTRFCLNAGGDIVAAGEPEPGEPWRIGVRHPRIDDKLCAVFHLRDSAIATSGGYERGDHIRHGATGAPAAGLISVSILAADLTTADAVATAAYAMGLPGVTWANEQPGCAVFAVDAADQVYVSDGVTNHLGDEQTQP